MPVYSTMIDGTVFYSETHVETVAQQSWWDGFLAGICITCFSLGVVAVVIMGK